MESFWTLCLSLAVSFLGQRQSFDLLLLCPGLVFGKLSITCTPTAGMVARKLPGAQPWWWISPTLGLLLPTADGTVEAIRCECRHMILKHLQEKYLGN